jgi:hypothetical protein
MDHDTTAEPATRRRGGVVGTARAGVSYVLFLVGIAALVSFFAPFVGVPDLAWTSSLLPTVAAPTERTDQFVNVAPLILGVVAASVAVWLR